MTGIDLSALDAFHQLPAEEGRPLQIGLERIYPDPEQPRKSFDQEALASLADSILVAGVKVPVSVRRHPTLPEAFVLNHGERRWRAARTAGLSTVPAFIEEQFTDFDQVIENLQREDLTPMELALFIERKVREGEKKGEIARRLGIHVAEITRHLALIDAPAALDAIYRSGRCTSPLTFYNLRTLYEKAPRAVEAWIDTGIEITRSAVEELKRGFQEQPGTSNGFDHDQIPNAGDRHGTSPSVPSSPLSDRGSKARHTPVLPIINIDIDGRAASVCLDKRPSDESTIFVLWSDSGSVEEILTARCRMTSLKFSAAASAGPTRHRAAPRADQQLSFDGVSPTKIPDKKG